MNKYIFLVRYSFSKSKSFAEQEKHAGFVYFLPPPPPCSTPINSFLYGFVHLELQHILQQIFPVKTAGPPNQFEQQQSLTKPFYFIQSLIRLLFPFLLSSFVVFLFYLLTNFQLQIFLFLSVYACILNFCMQALCFQVKQRGKQCELQANHELYIWPLDDCNIFSAAANNWPKVCVANQRRYRRSKKGKCIHTLKLYYVER